MPMRQKELAGLHSLSEFLQLRASTRPKVARHLLQLQKINRAPQLLRE